LKIGSSVFTPKLSSLNSTKSIEEYEILGTEQSDSTIKSSENKKLNTESQEFKPSLKKTTTTFRPNSFSASNVTTTQQNISQQNFINVSVKITFKRHRKLSE